jgi:hypothetical protein
MASLMRVRPQALLGAGYTTDVFVAGLERIESAGGGCLRFVLYVEGAAGPDGALQRLPAPVNVIAPLSAVPDAIGKMLAAIGRQVLVRPDGSITVKH